MRSINNYAALKPAMITNFKMMITSLSGADEHAHVQISGQFSDPVCM